jgi:hypothetical protein
MWTPAINFRMAALVAGAFLLLGLCMGAYRHGYNDAKAKGDAALSKFQTEAQAHYNEAVRAANQRFAAQAQLGNALSERLHRQNGQLAQMRNELNSGVSNVTTFYRETPGGARVPLPRAVFTVGWVRDYNTIFGLSDPEAPTSSGRVAAKAGQAGATGAGVFDLDSGVTEADILSSVNDTGAWCREIEHQRDALADYVRGLK